MTMPNVNPYSTHTVNRDIVINGMLAFSKGERVTVPGYLPGALRAGDSCIVFSSKLQQQVQLSAVDLQEIPPKGSTRKIGRRSFRWGYRRYLSLLVTLAVLGALAFGVYVYLFDEVINNSASMEPTIHNGEKVRVEHFSYKIDTPDTGHIVQIAYPFDSKDPEQFVILRVIASHNDRLQISGGNVYINDIEYREDYAVKDTYSMQEMTIPKDNLFVMGDNRAHSTDSRHWGLVPVSAVRGKVMR